jgi:Tol biopolymer transport system component
LAGILVVVLTSPAAEAQRTKRISMSVNAADTDAPSRQPAINSTGDVVAFESTGTNIAIDPNGPVSDVFARNTKTGVTRLVSAALDGAGADGPSTSPSLDGAGGRIAFASDATNLVPGDANGVADIFVRTGDGPSSTTFLITTNAAGEQANGASSEPDIARGGQFVAFTSTATNLVPGDTNGVADVFVKDLLSGVVTRVSTAAVGDVPDGPSMAPAISPGGDWVSFYSSATNVVVDDVNGVPDVFAAKRDGTETVLVSVSSQGRQQNRAVTAPFVQISDISRDGRFVAFDSDASNLVSRDRNRDTDVFVRDLVGRRTQRISVDLYLREGNGDSFAPSITNSGRYVAFTSLAQNLTPGDRSREDVFVHDRQLRATSIASVTPRGRPRVAEVVGQLLQRPAIADTGSTVAFTTTSPNFAGADNNKAEDVFVRDLAPVAARFRDRPRRIEPRRPTYRLTSAAPKASYYLCFLNGIRTVCPRRGRLPALPRGRYHFVLRPGGPGLLFGDQLQTRFRVR